MWDDPRLLNTFASALYALALTLTVIAAATMLARSPEFSLRTIRIDGPLHKVTRRQIVDALQGRVSGTFFTTDIDHIRSLLETIPWVRRAQVRRHWPDRLDVRLEEQVAFARWGQGDDERLVNTHGEVFSGRIDAQSYIRLPQLSGPAGSAAEVARRYVQFRELLKPIGLSPRVVVLSRRRSWSLLLDDGLTLQLGHENNRVPIRERIARFVDVYPRTLARLPYKVQYVDLRYPNGFALRVPEAGRNESKKSKRDKA